MRIQSCINSYQKETLGQYFDRVYRQIPKLPEPVKELDDIESLDAGAMKAGVLTENFGRFIAVGTRYGNVTVFVRNREPGVTVPYVVGYEPAAGPVFHWLLGRNNTPASFERVRRILGSRRDYADNISYEVEKLRGTLCCGKND